MVRIQKIRKHELEVGDRVDISGDDSEVIGYVTEKTPAGYQVRVESTGKNRFFLAHNLSYLPDPKAIAANCLRIQMEWTKRQEVDHRAVKNPEAELPVWDELVPETLQHQSEIW